MQKYALKRFFDYFKQKKFRASSIVEVIVALAICITIFLISMTVIINSQRSNNIRLKQKAQLILSTVGADNQLQDASFDNGSLRLETDIQEKDTIPDIRIVSYSVFDNAGHKLGMKVIWIPVDKLSEMNLSEDSVDNNL